jgi:outer membrane lipoprotein-sorting protein
MRRPLALLATLAALIVAVHFESGARAAGAADPWQLLAQTREGMQKSGPQLWTFAQTYLPTGFDRGEEERGRVALDLPKCVRWDYDDPYPKSFLLCGETLWSWNSGEPAGHMYALDQAQPGLDLLLLATGELSQRYTATAQAAGNATRVALVPKAGGTHVLKDAAILVGNDGTLRELTYRDAEGNRTTFRFSDRRALSDRSVFTAPGNVKWQREGGATP